MALYPALRVTRLDGDLALATADDWRPVAAEPSDDGCTIFFATRTDRDEAARAVAHAFPDAAVASVEVDDGDWARRSQEHLTPVVVGRVTVRPATGAPGSAGHAREPGTEGQVEVVIQPSMGFGTGHHATTRLCLAALQRLPVEGATVLDIGTGSGVLALAADALGAARALGIDYDPDALDSARENLPRNPALDGVEFRLADLTGDPLPPTDVVLANLTGTLLCRSAGAIMAGVRPGGCLVVSGVLDAERDAVVSAFSALALEWEAHEDEWIGFIFRRMPLSGD